MEVWRCGKERRDRGMRYRLTARRTPVHKVYIRFKLKNRLTYERVCVRNYHMYYIIIIILL